MLYFLFSSERIAIKTEADQVKNRKFRKLVVPRYI